MLKVGDMIEPEGPMKIVKVGTMPNDSDVEAALCEWWQDGKTFQCWVPCSELQTAKLN